VRRATVARFAVWNNDLVIRGDLEYTVRLSCSREPQCPRYLSKTLECSGEPSCRCVRTSEPGVPAQTCVQEPRELQSTPGAVVLAGRACEYKSTVLDLELSRRASIAPGRWAHFTVDVPADLIPDPVDGLPVGLGVDLLRRGQSGNPFLFVKQEFDPSGYWTDGRLPSDVFGPAHWSDFRSPEGGQGWADLARYQTKEDRMHQTLDPLPLPVPGAYFRRFHVSVLNLETAVTEKQTAEVELRPYLSQPRAARDGDPGWPVVEMAGGSCPFGCLGRADRCTPTVGLVGFEQGYGQDVCECRLPYAGKLCEAELQSIFLNDDLGVAAVIDDEAPPGAWKYYQILRNPESDAKINSGESWQILVEQKQSFGADLDYAEANQLKIFFSEGSPPDADACFGSSSNQQTCWNVTVSKANATRTEKGVVLRAVWTVQNEVIEPIDREYPADRAGLYVGIYNPTHNINLTAARQAVLFTIELIRSKASVDDISAYLVIMLIVALIVAMIVTLVGGRIAFRWHQARFAVAGPHQPTIIIRGPGGELIRRQVRQVLREQREGREAAMRGVPAHVIQGFPEHEWGAAGTKQALSEAMVAARVATAAADEAAVGESAGGGHCDGDPASDDDPSCTVCLCEYEDQQKVRLMPCGHYFHTECVDEWLVAHHTCPMCRHVLFRRPRLARIRQPHAAQDENVNAPRDINDNEVLYVEGGQGGGGDEEEPNEGPPSQGREDLADIAAEEADVAAVRLAAIRAAQEHGNMTTSRRGSESMGVHHVGALNLRRMTPGQVVPDMEMSVSGMTDGEPSGRRPGDRLRGQAPSWPRSSVSVASAVASVVPFSSRTAEPSEAPSGAEAFERERARVVRGRAVRAAREDREAAARDDRRREGGSGGLPDGVSSVI